MKDDELLIQAKLAPAFDKKRPGKWTTLVPILKVLRKKNYTHKQISEWLTNHGVKCHTSDVSQAYRRYLKGV